MAKKKNAKRALDDRDWELVFALRCKCKKGERISDEEQVFLLEAYEADPRRYAALNEAVFEATAPFGSRGTT